MLQHFFTSLLFLTVLLGVNAVILSTWLDLMTRCQGTCYYYPQEGQGELNHRCKDFVYGETGRKDSQGAVNSWNESCRYVVSIQAYIPSCNTFDRQPLSDRMCQYYNQNNASNTLFLITVARRFPIQGCNLALDRNPPFELKAYKKEYEDDENPLRRNGACNVWDENVAFTLSTSQETNLTSPFAAADELYYVCTNEGLTSYPYDNGQELSVDPNKEYKNTISQRITLAAPYSDGPPGILWSRVRKPPGERTIICSFVLSTDRFPYRRSKWRNEGRGVGKEDFKHVLTANELKPRAIHLDPYATALWLKVGETNITRYYFDKFQNLILKDEEDRQNKTKRIYTKWIINSKIVNVQTSSNVVDLKALTDPNDAKFLPPPIDPVQNAEVLRKIDSIYATCRDKRAMCFNFPQEEGCQSREKCHMLVVIEELFNFERLHIDMLSHPHSPHPVVKPFSYGWMGLAFSNDSRMGGEAVFTCSHKGRRGSCIGSTGVQVNPHASQAAVGECSKVYISINLEHAALRAKGYEEKNNYFSDNQIDPLFGDYQQLIENPYVETAEVPSESEPRVLCSFDIRTRDYTNISMYPKRPREVLRYDLRNKEYHVLMATGRSLAGDWQISYHGLGNRASGTNMKFSRKIYRDTVVKDGTGHAHIQG